MFFERLWYQYCHMNRLQPKWSVSEGQRHLTTEENVHEFETRWQKLDQNLASVKTKNLKVVMCSRRIMLLFIYQERLPTEKSQMEFHVSLTLPKPRHKNNRKKNERQTKKFQLHWDTNIINPKIDLVRNAKDVWTGIPLNPVFAACTYNLKLK